MNILADASLAKIAAAFPPPFRLTLYRKNEEVSQLLAGQTNLVCRSTLKVGRELLQGQPLHCVATASSGVDHIDLGYLRAHGIQLIDAKGTNANAVADYVLASLAFLQKYKNFSGKNAAIIGVGAVGSQIALRLERVGMEVIFYDPLRKQAEPNFPSSSSDAVMACELICIHANLHDNPPFPSRNLIDEKLLQGLRPGTAIINAARGGVVDEGALLKAPHLIYCTDVFNNEPAVNKEIIDFATLCTPHIAGHSIEAKFAAVNQISHLLHERYNLVSPQISPPPAIFASDRTHYQNWQEAILSFYNPSKETAVLKGAQDIKTTFAMLRAAHNFRHDFAVMRYKHPLLSSSPA